MLLGHSQKRYDSSNGFTALRRWQQRFARAKRICWSTLPCSNLSNGHVIQHFSEELRRDIKTFFGNYHNAQEEARQLLFSAGNRDLVRQLCREAASNGLGWLEKDRALYLHTSLVERLPAVLRVYVGCASYVFGDVTSADLIKIHIDSAKITLLSCDDFAGKPLPRLLERIKIRLRDQDVDRFTYSGPYEPPYLHRKSRFITEDFPHYAEQVAFEKALDAFNLFNSRRRY